MNVIARSRATKQSSSHCTKILDCVASLAMTNANSWTMANALHRAFRLHIERVQRMRRCHVEPVVLRSAESEVGATLRQVDEADRLALRIEHHYAVEVLRLGFERIDLAAID